MASLWAAKREGGLTKQVVHGGFEQEIKRGTVLNESDRLRRERVPCRARFLRRIELPKELVQVFCDHRHPESFSGTRNGGEKSECILGFLILWERDTVVLHGKQVKVEFAKVGGAALNSIYRCFVDDASRVGTGVEKILEVAKLEAEGAFMKAELEIVDGSFGERHQRTESEQTDAPRYLRYE